MRQPSSSCMPRREKCVHHQCATHCVLENHFRRTTSWLTNNRCKHGWSANSFRPAWNEGPTKNQPYRFGARLRLGGSGKFKVIDLALCTPEFGSPGHSGGTEAFEIVGVKTLRFNDLRHECANWHIQSSPLLVLKGLCGWKTLETVKKYAHFAPGLLTWGIAPYPNTIRKYKMIIVVLLLLLPKNIYKRTGCALIY